MYTKKSGRMTFKSGRRPSYKKTGGYINNKNRNRGNVSQQYNKYLKLAKEAFTSGDRIQSEYYYQFTDHYFRLMAELGINLDENNTEDAKQSNTEANSNESSAERNENVKESEESIESIPFIAEPTKEKRTRSVK
tara:strand:- start:346 stop:750 length:405 start_codon:yes stop_codon:yes gene_type:complete